MSRWAHSRSFDAAARHTAEPCCPVMWQQCTTIGRLVVGQAAQAILDADTDGSQPLPDSDVALLILPTWMWTTPATPAGRKTRSRDGGDPLHLPIRVTWSTGPILVGDATASSVWELDWSASGLGVTQSGCVKAETSCDPTGTNPALDGAEHHLSPAGPTPVTPAAVYTPRDARELLTQLAADAVDARWDLLVEMERRLAIAVGRAHTSLSIEVAEPSGSRPLLDSTQIENLVTRLTYGDTDAPDSPVMRIVDRVVEPALFTRVDPTRWVETKLRQTAHSGIRSLLDDPEIGSRIRRIARTIGSTDPDTVLGAYRAHHPGDLVGISRISRALALTARSSIREHPRPDFHEHDLPLWKDPGAA